MKLFVQNFPFDVTESELETCLSQWGEVAYVRVIRDRETGHSKGYGFAEMVHDRDAMLVIQELDGTEWGGRTLHCAEARERAPRTEEPREHFRI